MVAEFAPPSDDHIVKFSPDEDIILAKDENGNELCRLAFDIDDKLVHFKTPLISKYGGFVKKMAVLLSYLTDYYGDIKNNKNPTAPYVEMPDDITESFKNPFYADLWKRLAGAAISSHPKVIEIILDIFFNYLDGQIEGITAQRKKWHTNKMHEKAIVNHQKSWFMTSCRMDAIQKAFSACLAVDDLIKKNAIFVLQKTMGLNLQPSTPQSLSNSSVQKPVSTPISTTDTQFSSLELL